MIVALVFAHVWGVIQLIVLGSLTRTVRVGTVLMALAAGLYACAPLTVLLQIGWIRSAAWLTGVPLWVMKDIATYTADPFIEEILKVLPVAALLLFPAMRRQWSLTDCVLTGAAAGSGFGLSESLFRYAAAADQAKATDQGWVLTTNISFPVVPGIWNTINSWLPAAGAPWDQISASGRFPPDPHLVWSALGGLAVGLMMLRRSWRWRTLGAALLLYVALDHAAWNAAIKSQAFVGRAAIEQLRTLWLMPILALALAWWLDRQRQRPGKSDEVILTAEQSASPRLVGTVRAAISRLPWSVPQVYGFVRMRRARNSERTSPWAHEAGDLSAALVNLRDRIDRQPGHARSSPWLPGWSRALGATLRRPSVIAWLLLMVPSVMWFVIGGFPKTAALQEVMTEPVAWKAVVALSMIAQAWLVWRVVLGLRALPMLRRSPWSDDVALSTLRVACGVGAVGLGGHALMRALSGFSPNSSLLDFADQTQAYGSGSPATGLQLANGAVAAVPVAAGGSQSTDIGEVDDPNVVIAGPSTDIGDIDDPNMVGAGPSTDIGDIDDPNVVGAGPSTDIGDIDDPNVVGAGPSTDIGDIDDPNVVGAGPSTDIGDIDDPNVVGAGPSTDIGDIDDPNVVGAGPSTDIGDIDDPNVVGAGGDSSSGTGLSALGNPGADSSFESGDSSSGGSPGPGWSHEPGVKGDEHVFTEEAGKLLEGGVDMAVEISKEVVKHSVKHQGGEIPSDGPVILVPKSTIAEWRKRFGISDPDDGA